MSTTIEYLLDTNIISELTKPKPDMGVVEFVAGLLVVQLSVITLHELEYGVNLLPEGKRKQKVKSVINQLVKRYTDYIIPLGQTEAKQRFLVTQLRDNPKKALQMLNELDAMGM